MSLEEQDQILGRLTRQARECNSRVVALQHKVLDYSILFDRTAAGLRLFYRSQGRHDFDAAHWPSASDIESTLGELESERQQLATLQEQIGLIR